MLGDKIRIYRGWGGLSIETLAKRLGITRQTLTKWEKGITIPDVISMKKISNILGVPIEKFLDGIEESELENTLEEQVKREEKLEKREKIKPQFGPAERYFFGAVTVRKDGRIEIPQKAMKKLGIEPGEKLLVLGDFERGLELIYEDILWEGRRNKMWDVLSSELLQEVNAEACEDEEYEEYESEGCEDDNAGFGMVDGELEKDYDTI